MLTSKPAPQFNPVPKGALAREGRAVVGGRVIRAVVWRVWHPAEQSPDAAESPSNPPQDRLTESEC